MAGRSVLASRWQSSRKSLWPSGEKYDAALSMTLDQLAAAAPRCIPTDAYATFEARRNEGYDHTCHCVFAIEMDLTLAYTRWRLVRRSFWQRLRKWRMALLPHAPLDFSFFLSFYMFGAGPNFLLRL